MIDRMPLLSSAWDVDRTIVLSDSASGRSGECKVICVRFSLYDESARDDHDEERGSGRKRQRDEGQDRDADEPPDAKQAEYINRLRKNCAEQDAELRKVAAKVRNYCKIYRVNTSHVQDFNDLYALWNPAEAYQIMFFFQNQHIKVDIGTGNHNSITSFVPQEELVTIIDSAYRAGRQGRDTARPQA